jgi:hypothetical protein
VLKKIACLGWGSLIWDHRTLPVVGGWMKDGPLLPIEFARESQDGRITLVLCDDVPLVQSYWGLISVEDVSYAIETLAEREGIKLNIAKNIGWWDSSDGKSRGKCAGEIEAWARSQWLDGVVWTNLPFGLKRSRGTMPTREEVLQHITALDEFQKQAALHYVGNAPLSIDTPYRRAIESEFGRRQT